jgi:hypothetical protein
MFTGFSTENTPAIQVWDFFSIAAGTITVALTDDCAPIQYFKTGGSTTNIRLYLPTAPIEGKQIKIIVGAYTSTNQLVSIYSSDTRGTGASTILVTIGPGQTLDLCYSKNFISVTAAVGTNYTGWVFLNQGNVSSAGYNSVVIGGTSNTVTGGQAGILAGNSNQASGSDSGIVGGSGNTASSLRSSVIGGSSNNSSFTNSFIGGGQSSTASGTSSAVVGGSNHLANSTSTIVIGGNYGTARSIEGFMVTPASVNPISATAGVSQSSLLVLGVETTDATATRLRSNTSTASSTNQVALPNNSAYVFQGTCIANITGGSTTSGWRFEGVIKRGANAASTALVAAVTPTVIAQDAAASTWVLAITADTTYGSIAVTVTGVAATTIRWVCRIQTTEVTY